MVIVSKNGQNFLYVGQKFLQKWSNFSIKMVKNFYYFGQNFLLRKKEKEGYTLKIELNSRQMPAARDIVREKNYCDLLYAWLQCNSEKVYIDGYDRRIAKNKVKWTAIEKDFTRVAVDGSEEKIMGRKTIAKYFDTLVQLGLVTEKDDGYYYLTLLNAHDANLIEYITLSKLMNVLQKNSINIYIYLFNRFYANGCEPFIATMKQIKDYIGIATSTTSNNLMVSDTIEILKRLGLLDMEVEYDAAEMKSYMKFIWINNRLPD